MPQEPESITRKDFVAMLRNAGLRLPVETFDRLASLFDVNEDGNISRAEFLAFGQDV